MLIDYCPQLNPTLQINWVKIVVVVNPIHIEILKQVFAHWVKYDTALPEDNLQLVLEDQVIEQELKILDISGLIKRSDGAIEITDAGRSKFKVVLTGGAYDLLHRGHLETLWAAKSLADFLVVVVARDITVNRRKRRPIHSEEDRVIVLNELNVVDAAILGDEIDHMRVVRRVKPDIVAIGADQHHIKQVLEEQIVDQGLPKTKITRLEVDYEGLATSRVIEEILGRNWEN